MSIQIIGTVVQVSLPGGLETRTMTLRQYAKHIRDGGFATSLGQTAPDRASIIAAIAADLAARPDATD